MKKRMLKLILKQKVILIKEIIHFLKLMESA